jgi:hypothetical protein
MSENDLRRLNVAGRTAPRKPRKRWYDSIAEPRTLAVLNWFVPKPRCRGVGISCGCGNRCSPGVARMVYKHYVYSCCSWACVPSIVTVTRDDKIGV